MSPSEAMLILAISFFLPSTTIIDLAVKIINGVTPQVRDINRCDVIGHAHASGLYIEPYYARS